MTITEKLYYLCCLFFINDQHCFKLSFTGLQTCIVNVDKLIVSLAIHDPCLKWLRAGFIPVNSAPTNATLLKISEVSGYRSANNKRYK